MLTSKFSTTNHIIELFVALVHKPKTTSSIHEVLILAADENDRQNLDHYTAMVKEVNASQLQDEEILSDHAYYYCRHSRLLTMPQPVCTS